MRTKLFGFVLLLSAVAALSPSWSAPTVSAGVSVFNKYLWRGFNLCDHAVWQPSVTISNEDTALNLWANLDGGDNGRCTEFDYTLTHSFGLGTVEATAGFIYYTFPSLDTGQGSKEIFLSVSGPAEVPLSLSGYHDFDEGDGLYLELGTEFPLSEQQEAGAVALALGYNAHQWREDTGFSHAAASYSREFPAGSWTFTPTLIYSVSLADDFKNEVCFGIGASRDF